MGCGGSAQKPNEKSEKSQAPAQQGVGPGMTGEQQAGSDGAGQKNTQVRSSLSKVKNAADDDPFGTPEEVAAAQRGEGSPPPTETQQNQQRNSFIPGFTFGEAGALSPEAPKQSDKPTLSPQQGSRQNPTRRSAVSAEVLELEKPEDWTAPVVDKDATAEARLRECLARHALFASFAKDDMDVVVKAMAEEKFAAGTEILQQGQESTKKYYIITDGEVDVIKHGETVAVFQPGNGFGDLELMYPGPCAATVKAKSDITTYTLDRDTYRVLVMKASLKRQKIFKDLLAGVSFLVDLNEHQRMTLADALETHDYSPGEKIITGGQDNDWMHIIYKGTVSVIGRDEAGQETNVCDFGKGDTVGELEFLHGHKCVADVVAKTEVTTCRLHRDHFELCMGPLKDFLKDKATGSNYTYYQTARTQFAEGFTFGDDDPLSEGAKESEVEPTPATSPEPSGGGQRPSSQRGGVVRREGVSAAPLEDDPDFVPPKVEKSAEAAQQLRDVVAANCLLKTLLESDREVLVDAMEECKFEKGQKILVQDETGGKHWYVISEGAVNVVRSGEVLVRKTKGDDFGELELMYDQPCRATVEAETDVVAWRIDRSTYQHIVMRVASKRREELRGLLKGVDVLKGIQSEDRITMLADALEEGRYEVGEKLIRHGETPEWMHVILDGSVDVVGRDGDEEKVVCSFTRGACVGELEFLNNHSCVADVVATTPVRTGKLHRSHFERVMGPIADLLKENAQTESYTYYREALGGFSFGEEGEEVDAPKAGAPEDAPRPMTGTVQRQKREAVSAEVYDEEEQKNFVPRFVQKTDSEREAIEKALSKNLLFSSLMSEAEPMRVVVDAMERAEFKAGETPMMQGEVGGEHWFVIETGSAEIVKNNVVVDVFGPGQGFGEMELMYACRTAATVRAAEDLLCWRLDRATYRHVIMRASQERRKRYKDALGGVEFLQVLSQWQQDQLADALQPCTFQEGDYIVRHGDQHEAMHIVVSGDVEVVGRDAEGEKQHVCKLSHGEMIGELEFLHPGAAVADVQALSEVKTLRLNREHFELCMGPVKDFMEQTALSDKYKYYQQSMAKISVKQG
eukprot:TRINITY_DN477_c4_g1_i1.p1 TRINITY_DN477_c4_g1~~TRINITY_DN477_c4_g1_i1.p1  ORF type:complete len:1082 (+),score=386.66 TRINITY_DN477_c4_g1_i1:215-3460(+)